MSLEQLILLKREKGLFST